MPDTSKMTKDEYYDHCYGKKSYPAGQKSLESMQDYALEVEADARLMKREAELAKSQGESMPEFKPEDAWLNDTKQPVKVVAVEGNFAWARPVFGGCGWVVRLDDITAIDPNQSAEPQKCPSCGHACEVFEDPFYVECANKQCKLSGPVKPTRHEAVAAWNRIYLKDD